MRDTSAGRGTARRSVLSSHVEKCPPKRPGRGFYFHKLGIFLNKMSTLKLRVYHECKEWVLVFRFCFETGRGFGTGYFWCGSQKVRFRPHHGSPASGPKDPKGAYKCGACRRTEVLDGPFTGRGFLCPEMKDETGEGRGRDVPTAETHGCRI